MAKGRMISKEISLDQDLARCSDRAVILYTFLIGHLDSGGKFYAIPDVLKGHVVPLRQNISSRGITLLLQELEKNDLIRIYGNNKEYLYCKGFLNHNKPHPHEPKSKIPDYGGKKM